MFRRTKKEHLPWYRTPDYKGNLTEGEKRELDSFRYRAEHEGVPHPVASFSDLPEEVGSYISKLEIELYDKNSRELGRSLHAAQGSGGISASQLFRLVHA